MRFANPYLDYPLVEDLTASFILPSSANKPVCRLDEIAYRENIENAQIFFISEMSLISDNPPDC